MEILDSNKKRGCVVLGRILLYTEYNDWWESRLNDV